MRSNLARYPTSFSFRRRDLIQPLRDSVDARRRRERPRAAAHSWAGFDRARYEEAP
jgi:hypothetical protein